MTHKEHHNADSLRAAGVFPAMAKQKARIAERRQSVQRTVLVNETEFVVFPGVYQTSVDTRLMSDVVRVRPGDDIVEVGCGCGAITLLMAQRCHSAVGVDISAVAVANARENSNRLKIDNVSFFVSDVFSKVVGQFDVVICNPPYNKNMADGSAERMFWDPNDDMKRRFFEGVLGHLKKNGRVYFGWGDFADLDGTLPTRFAEQAGLIYVRHYSSPSSDGAHCFYVIEFTNAGSRSGSLSFPSHVAGEKSVLVATRGDTTPRPVEGVARDTRSERIVSARRREPPQATGSDEVGSHIVGTSVPARFIDLFCGIGGFRLAFERAGCRCVWSCDWDAHSRTTYAANFGETPHGDIHSIAVADIPSHDILCAGFPCQPFSIAGVSKKQSLGRKHGFQDEKQGNLFFSIAELLDVHRPAAFVLENVKNLKTHDKGHTFQVIRDTLENALGYTIYHKVIDARCFVPQHRERVFIVGFKEPCYFEFPTCPSAGPTLSTILDADVPDKYTLTDHLWKYLRDYAAKHKAAGNGFGYGLATGADVARTLSARYYKDGSEILISQGPHKNPRRLTPKECARLMGYPDGFRIAVSDTQAYRQFGNSVVVPVVEAVAREVVTSLRRPLGEPPPLVLREKRRTGLPRQLPERRQTVVYPMQSRRKNK